MFYLLVTNFSAFNQKLHKKDGGSRSFPYIYISYMWLLWASSWKWGMFTCKFGVIGRADQVYGYFHQAKENFVFQHLQSKLGRTSKVLLPKQQCSPTTTDKSPSGNLLAATKGKSRRDDHSRHENDIDSTRRNVQGSGRNLEEDRCYY